MSRMSDMAQTIEELRSAAAAITDAANWLAQQFNSDAEEAPITEAQLEKKPELTLEQVRAVLADKSRAGHTAAVRDLLQKYGAAKLSQSRADGGQWSQRSEDEAERRACPLGGIADHLRVLQQGLIVLGVNLR